MNYQKQFKKQAISYPKLSKEEQEELFLQLYQARNDDDTALVKKIRDKLINSNLRLVIKIAGKYNYSKFEFMDLVQEGSIGLMWAVDGFQIERGNTFGSYAYSCIQGLILRYIYNNYRMIKFQAPLVKEIQLLRAAEEKLEDKLGRSANLTELAEELEKSIDEVFNIKRDANFDVSLDEPVKGEDGDEDEMTLLGTVECPEEGEDQLIDQLDINHDIRAIFKVLTDEEKAVFRLKYQIYDKVYTKKYLESLNIPPERFRQVEAKAIYKVRKLIDKNK